MFKLIRRLFANLGKASEPKVPYLRTPLYMNEVEDNLDRYFGRSIERRNPHIPELRIDQFDRDLGAMQPRPSPQSAAPREQHRLIAIIQRAERLRGASIFCRSHQPAGTPALLRNVFHDQRSNYPSHSGSGSF